MKTNTYLDWIDFLIALFWTLPSALFFYKACVGLSFTQEQSIFLTTAFNLLLFGFSLLGAKVSNYIADKNVNKGGKDENDRRKSDSPYEHSSL